jgi:hypothetical protein
VRVSSGLPSSGRARGLSPHGQKTRCEHHAHGETPGTSRERPHSSLGYLTPAEFAARKVKGFDSEFSLVMIGRNNGGRSARTSPFMNLEVFLQKNIPAIYAI